MKIDQQQRAAFYAHLASIPSLDELKEWERLKLIEDAKQLDFEHLAFGDEHGQHPNLWDGIAAAHRWAVFLVGGLVDGKSLNVEPLHAIRTFYRLQLSEDGKIMTGYKVKSENHILVDLLELLSHGAVFPFRRCPVCSTIFVFTKRQKFCSPRCTSKGMVAARQDERREYMRQYMSNRRKRAKKAKTTTKRKEK